MTKRVFLILLLIVSAWATEARDRDYEQLRDSIVDYSKNYIGCRYSYGSKGPKTFDCSGFTSFVFKRFGYTLNSSSATQYTQGEKIKLKNAKKGDLIFFKGSNASSNSVGHVGMITNVSAGGDTVQFIHAAVKGGVRLDTYPGYLYYNVRFIECKRIFGEMESDTPVIQPDEQPEEQQEVVSEVVQEIVPEVQPETQDTVTHEETQPTPAPTETEKEVEEAPEKVKKEARKEGKKKEKRKKDKSSKEESELKHIVRKGETLYRISINYGCKVEDIQKWNKLTNTNIKIGQELIIKKK